MNHLGGFFRASKGTIYFFKNSDLYNQQNLLSTAEVLERKVNLDTSFVYGILFYRHVKV